MTGCARQLAHLARDFPYGAYFANGILANFRILDGVPGWSKTPGCSSAGKGNWSIALHRGRGSCTRSSGPLYTIVVRSYKVSDVAQSVHAVVPGNRAAITLATTRFLHTCTMIPLKICSSQAVEKGQISEGVDSQFVSTRHVLCETERPRLAADLAQPRGPDGEAWSVGLLWPDVIAARSGSNDIPLPHVASETVQAGN